MSVAGYLSDVQNPTASGMHGRAGAYEPSGPPPSPEIASTFLQSLPIAGSAALTLLWWENSSTAPGANRIDVHVGGALGLGPRSPPPAEPGTSEKAEGCHDPRVRSNA